VDGARRLGELADGDHTNDQFVEILSDQQQPEDGQLPKRGKPIEAERHLGSCFISDSNYGTRASTVVRMGRRQIYFCEQTYLPDGVVGPKVEYEFLPEREEQSTLG
jgi:uncharacterized protein with NRDE domain